MNHSSKVLMPVRAEYAKLLSHNDAQAGKMTQSLTNSEVSMLFSIIVTLLIAINGIPRIQAEENREIKAQLNGTSVNGVDSIIEVLTTQENNTFNTGPNDKSKYGSFVEVQTDIYKSPNSRQPDSTQTRTVAASGGPGHDGVSYVRSEDRNHQGQPNQNQTLDNNVKLIVHAETDMYGNSFNSEPGSDNFYGSRIKVHYHINKSEGNNNLTQPNENQISSYGGPIVLNAKARVTNNHFFTDPGMKVNVGNNINYHVYLNSHTDKQAQGNKEKEESEEKHTESNGQTSLSSNAFYSFSCFLVILLKYSLF